MSNFWGAHHLGTLRARKTQIYALYRLFVCLKVWGIFWDLCETALSFTQNLQEHPPQDISFWKSASMLIRSHISESVQY